MRADRILNCGVTADAIAATDLTDVNVTGAKLYLLNSSEAYVLPLNVKKCSREGIVRFYWWIRSTGGYINYAAYVDGNDGRTDIRGTHVLNHCYVRPALKLDLSSVTFSSRTRTFSLKPVGHSVTITPGSNMTKTSNSGAASQTGLTGAMTNVVYTANEGYHFPTTYRVASVNGISVIRNSYSQITVSGTPTADAAITLTAPTAKTKPSAPTTAVAVNCATAANNDGKLTGVTTAMEYRKSDATSWTAGKGNDITGLVPGTYYVRVKATDTTLASDNQVLTVKPFISATVTFKVVNGSWNDNTTANKTVTLTGHEGDTLKLTADQIPAVGNKPNDTYKAGSWDVTPSTETAITKATTYTYTYAAKTPISQTVTFKVVNGSWNDNTKTDKTVTLTGYEGDTLKLAADQIPAVGNKPNDTYKAGSWDVTPSTETAITKATIYTYTYAAKTPISQTVTFKVVNGSWNDNTKTDKTVKLTGYEDDTLKLAADQIPAVGNKPNDTYKAGSWDVTPNTETAITSATTYTYTYAQKESAVVTTAPTAKNLTYTGSDQELVTAGEATDGTMQYALGTEITAPTSGWDTSIPKATDAGTYYVWYKASGDTNYTDTNPECITVIIEHKSVIVTFKVMNGLWDDGTKNDKTETLIDNSYLTLSQIPTSGTKPDDGYKVGSWDKVPNTETSITADTIYTYTYEGKPVATITIEPAVRDLTENGKPQELVTAGEASGGTMEYVLGVTVSPDGWRTSIPIATDAGVYYVWYRAKGDADHSSTEPECLVVTMKYGAGTLVYNGEEQKLVKPGTAQGGTMVYVLGKDDVTAPVQDWNDKIPTGKEVGDYYVWYKVRGDENHNDIEPKCIKVTIVPDNQVEQFKELINTLPEDVGLEDADLVKALSTLYDSLSEDQKKLIPEEDLRKLPEAEEKLKKLNKAIAERFTTAVNAVPGNKAGEGKGLVDKATEIYKTMTDAQKALVKQETYDLYDEEVAAFKRNRQFRSGDAYYKVLSNGDVTYLKPASKDIEDVTVPNQVKKGKFFFKVIKVSNNAFRNCKNLKWAVIGKNVYVFGQYIFARDEKLTKVRVFGTRLKSGKVSDAFVRAGKNGKVVVKVPGSKVNEYRSLFTGEGGLNGRVEAA